VVLDLDGEPPVTRLLGWPLGYRPALQDAVFFESQVPVEVARVVLLDDVEAPAGRRLASLGLWALREVPPALVLPKVTVIQVDSPPRSPAPYSAGLSSS